MSAPRPVEYLYGHDTLMCGFDGNDCDCYGLHGRELWEYHLVRYRVTKKTAKRIYYVRSEPRRNRQVIVMDDLKIGFVDRQKLEADGEVTRKSAGWWTADFTLYATTDPPEWWERSYPDKPKPDVSQLRREMADAHPDRGGTRETFEAARSRYLVAKGVLA
jgi:hypothetical protein